MSERQKNLSKKTSAQRTPFQVKVLSAERWIDRGYHLRRTHTHSYWHLNLMARGKIRIRLRSGGGIEMGADRPMLFPAGQPHGFEHPDAPYDMLSVRFEVDAESALGFDGVLVAPLSPFWRSLQEAFFALVPMQGTGLAQVGEGSVAVGVMEGLVAASLRYMAETVLPRQDSLRAELVARARRYIRLSVDLGLAREDVARGTGCGARLLAKMFREEEGVSLKTYIDRVRAQRAQELLRQSGVPIYRIARNLGFPDPFTFSKFFRRMVGAPPRQYRKEALAGGKDGPAPEPGSAPVNGSGGF